MQTDLAELRTMTKLYANISVEHNNCLETLKSRVISAAQCNCDAVVLHKTTPTLLIAEEKKYLSMPSPWGNISYIDLARRREISAEHTEEVLKLCEQIGIPLIWCVTDAISAEFARQHSNGNSTVKLHRDSIDLYELTRYCANNFSHVIFSNLHRSDYDSFYVTRRDQFTVCYTTTQFPPSADQLNFCEIDSLIDRGHIVGYESREPGVFPAVALRYKGVDFIEKYLGDEDSNNSCVLTPQQMYEFFKNLELLEIANGTPGS
jgi:sialic acid synthase SpsE